MEDVAVTVSVQGLDPRGSQSLSPMTAWRGVGVLSLHWLKCVVPLLSQFNSLK